MIRRTGLLLAIGLVVCLGVPAAQTQLTYFRVVNSGRGTWDIALGTAGQVLTSNGVDHAPSFQAGGGGSGSPGGADRQVQFNNAGSFGGHANLAWYSNKELNVGGFPEATVAGVYIKSVDSGGLYNFVISDVETGASTYPVAANIAVNANPPMGVNAGEAWALTIDAIKSDAGDLDALHGIEIHNQVAGGSVTVQHALLIDDLSGATTNYAIKTGTGQVSFGDLTSTGSAAGKKVVCVDTSTGRLYASSTGTDCSN